jgi:hypothetical protein
VKRFSSAGWRVITCSRHGFPERSSYINGAELSVDGGQYV